MTTATVIVAEATLIRAKAEARQKRIDDTKIELKAVRVRAKQLRKEMAVIAEEVTQTDLEVATLRGQLASANTAIARLSAPSADVLDDPADRDGELTALRAYQTEVLHRLETAQMSVGNRLRGVEIKQELEHLQFVGANLLNLIENDGRLGWEGGISPVA